MLRQGSPKIACSDWTYGATKLNFESGDSFGVNQIAGFDRYGGSRCNVKDRFIIDFYGSISLPAGYSKIRFNTKKNEIDEAAILFIDDASGNTAVLRNMTEEKAALCNSDRYYVECLTDDSEPVYDINVGTSAGDLPIEIVYVELEDEVHMNVELSIHGDSSFTPIPKEIISYPKWWDEE